MNQHRRITTAAAAAVLSALLLAGCSTPDADGATPSPDITTTPSASPTESSTPSASPSPTPSTQPSPASAEEATAAAEDAIEQFLIIRAAVNAAGGTDTAPLKEVATGRALELVLSDAANTVTDQERVEGRLLFEPASATAGQYQPAGDTTAYPFASVTVTGCQDASEYKLYKPDGSESPQPPTLRNEVTFTVIWTPSRSKWLIDNMAATGATC